MKSIHKILASPILWGGILSVGFYYPLHQGWITHPFVQRYFGSHPILHAITIMFLVGLASLLIKYFSVLIERGALRQIPILDTRLPQKVDVHYVDHYLAAVERHTKKYGESLLSQRLRLALQYVKRSGSATELDAELRYLADEDAAKTDANYGLVRLVLWAIPMVGFLGTVVGITVALGNLNLNAINESSQALSVGLSVAFDTTALGIGLDLLLYCLQFLVYREENHLLLDVDKLTDNELHGRFEMEVRSSDNGQVVAVRRMLESVVASLEQLMNKQSLIWEQTLTAANQRFSQMTEQNAEILKKSLVAALGENISLHAQSLVQAETRFLEHAQETTRKFSETLRQNAASIATLQDGTVKQTEAIRNMLGTGSQLIKLEENLHQNLTVLAQVGNFEETVNSLAAAIHLLNARRAA